MSLLRQTDDYYYFYYLGDIITINRSRYNAIGSAYERALTKATRLERKYYGK